MLSLYEKCNIVAQNRNWILTDDKAGTRAQAVALANALGIEAEIKTVFLKKPFSKLPLSWVLRIKDLDKTPINNVPELVIAAGRGAVPAALLLKKHGAQVVFLQDPYIDPAHFDVVIAPAHDRLRGQNVMATIGALSKINSEILNAIRAQAEEKFTHMVRPYIVVLIGGQTGLYKFDEKTARALVRQLLALQEKYQGSLLVTASRRTPKNVMHILHQRLVGNHIYFWDGVGDNPYEDFLSVADFVLVTEDSVSMHTEAAATGKPVYTIALPRRLRARIKSCFGRNKFDRFYMDLQQHGISRPLHDTLDRWRYEPLNEAGRIARIVKEKLEKL